MSMDSATVRWRYTITDPEGDVITSEWYLGSRATVALALLANYSNELGTVKIEMKGAERMSKVHKSITLDRVMAAVQRQMRTLDNPGFCVSCGADAEGCEPDMRKGPCELCGERAVYGAEELLIHMAL